MSTGTIAAPITPTQDLPSEELEISPPDGMSHYARRDKLVEPGGILTALCGKKWIPQERFLSDSDKPICPKCKELMEFLEAMDGV